MASLRGAAHVLPDFLLVGVQKGGTTSLYHALAQHPDVRGVGAKEVFYFDRQFGRGERWYRCWFPTHGAMARARTQAPEGVALTGEASTTYFDHPSVPARVAALVPEAKILVVLRDPAERALSHYFHNRRKGREPLGPLEAFRAGSRRLGGEVERVLADPAADSEALAHFGYLRRGHYAEHLARWAEHVPPERTLVLRSDDLFARPADTLARAIAFLGLAPWTPDAFTVRNTGTNRRDVAPEVRAFLAEYFAPHTARLGEWLGAEVGWR
ncbi:MAG: sulfotransferase domain-containing protein [Bacteroidota bacterium]